MFENDKRVVMTLDAGGTNLVFTAIQGNKEIIEPIRYPSQPNDLNKCLEVIAKGFEDVKAALKTEPVAISFAFPGPADYAHGVIGDLPNFPAFRGGIALGGYLEEKFGIPVFINNDGSLFAYGEALGGFLPYVNAELKKAGSSKTYKNLLGLTFGTGFGAGAVIDGHLIIGDNNCGGDIWCFRNKKFPGKIIEESVSIRAAIRVYKEKAGITNNIELTPKDIFDIAEGTKEGNRQAAIDSFAEMGEMAGDTVAQAVTVVDGLVAIGGGLTGAAKYILPAMIKEMGANFGTFAGDSFPRMQFTPYNLEDKAEFEKFVSASDSMVTVPGSSRQVKYNSIRQIGVGLSKLGTSQAICIGAYAFALSQIDQH